MIEIILVGSSGRIGKEFSAFLKDNEKYKIVAKIDKNQVNRETIKNIDEYKGYGDVIVDFSHHSYSKQVLSYGVIKSIPVIIATTGHSLEEEKYIKNASTIIPVMKTPNLSKGLNLINNIAKNLLELYPESEIEITEVHHKNKKDIPGGTSVFLQNELKTAECIPLINSFQIGESLGIHEILIKNKDEGFAIRHEVYSKSVYIEGALKAIDFIVERKKGLYNAVF